MNAGVVGWWTYYTSPIIETTQLIATDLPYLPSGKVRLKINRANGVAACGEIVPGSLLNIGKTETKPKIKIFDFSKIEEDQYGNLKITKRGARQEITYSFCAQGLRAEFLYNKLAKITGTLAVWIGDEDSRLNLINYGYMDDFQMDMEASYGPDRANAFGKIDVKGVV